MLAPTKMPIQNFSRLRLRNCALTIPARPSIVIASGSSKVMPKMAMRIRTKLMYLSAKGRYWSSELPIPVKNLKAIGSAKKANPIPIANSATAEATKPTAKRRSLRRRPGATKVQTCQMMIGLLRTNPVKMPILKKSRNPSTGPP